MILFPLIFLFFLPLTKSGAAITVCPACAFVCIVPVNPICIACVASLCAFAPVLTGCFNSDTKIFKLEDGQIKAVSIYELKKNDLVVSNNEKKLTKVVRNIKSEGIFDYIKIILESGKELTITNEHGIIVIDDQSNKRVIKANNLRVGQKLITLKGPEAIKNINSLKIKDKYILKTEEGTDIANSNYVNTIC